MRGFNLVVNRQSTGPDFSGRPVADDHRTAPPVRPANTVVFEYIDDFLTAGRYATTSRNAQERVWFAIGTPVAKRLKLERRQKEIHVPNKNMTFHKPSPNGMTATQRQC